MLKESSDSGYPTAYCTIAAIGTGGIIIALKKKVIAFRKEHDTIVVFDQICLMNKQTRVVTLRREDSHWAWPCTPINISQLSITTARLIV